VDAVTDALQTIQNTPVDTPGDFTEMIHQRMVEADTDDAGEDDDDDGRVRCPDCGAPLRQSLGGKQCPECRWVED
jgi:rubrerythrin